MSFTSKLGNRHNVIRGMGSGNLQNQKMAGSSEPVVDAGLASEQIDEEVLEELKSKEAEIFEAISEGFDPSKSPPFEPKDIEGLHQELVAWQEKIIDEEMEEELGYPNVSPDDPLYNPMTDIRRKRSIEDNLTPLSFEDMVFKGYTDQEVKLRDNFVVVFRTISTQQGLWIEQLMTNIRDESMQYGRHWLSLKQLACSIQTINGKSIGSNLSSFTKPSQKEDFFKALDVRFEAVTRMPSILTDDLIVNYTWFTGRVRKLLSGDVGTKVGN